MSIRLEAIGFGPLETDKAVAKTLSQVAKHSTEAGPRKLLFRPFDGCCIETCLDDRHEPCAVSVMIEAPLQAVLVSSIEPIKGEYRITAFSCVDGRAVVPLNMFSPLPPPDHERRGVALAQICGFTHSLQVIDAHPNESGVDAVADDGSMILQGVVLSEEERLNRLTGESVSLGAIWMPGLELRYAARGSQNVRPGNMVRGAVRIYAEIQEFV
jgi:hypothetical protein